MLMLNVPIVISYLKRNKKYVVQQIHELYFEYKKVINMCCKYINAKKIIKEYMAIFLVLLMASIVYKVFTFGFEYIRYFKDFALNCVISSILGVIVLISKALYLSLVLELINVILNTCISGIFSFVNKKMESKTK